MTYKELEELFDEVEEAMRTSLLHWNSFLIETEDWRRIRHKYLLKSKIRARPRK